MQEPLVLIGVAGRKYHGKGTIGDILVSEHGFTQLSLAGPMKKACAEIFSLDESQLYGDRKEIVDDYWQVTPREIMQFVGTELFRNGMSALLPQIGTELWIKVLSRRIQVLRSQGISKIVVTDVRYPDEANAIKEQGGKVVKVIRKSMLSVDSHSSEVSIDLIIPDTVMHNDQEDGEYVLHLREQVLGVL